MNCTCASTPMQPAGFGMLEAEDEPGVSAALFGAAQEWLREQGMERQWGPFNLHINEEVGLLVDGLLKPAFHPDG